MSLYSFGSSRSSISERSIWSRASRRPRLPIPPLVFPPPPLSNIFREYDDDLDNLSDRPENVNLPPSDDESERSGPTLQHYLSFVRDLSRSVPQLRVVSTLPQFRKGFRLEIRDYSVINGELTVKESAVNRRVNWTAMKKQLARTERPEESSSRVREAGRRLADTTSGNVQRTIYVEDLSPGIISALGTALDINPVFFAEHLADSIYGSETQLPREAWVDTHNEDTTWSVSLEWFRPVMLDTDDYQLALDLQRAPERSYSQVLRGVYHLATEPSTKSNKLMTRAIWREKISVWCNTGKSVSVVLVDPTPGAWTGSFSKLAGFSKSLDKTGRSNHQKIITDIKNYLNSHVSMYHPANKSRAKNKRIFIPSFSSRKDPVKAADSESESPSTLSWILDETLCSIKRKQDLQYSPAIHMRLICNDMNDMMDAIEQELQKIDRDMMDADLVQTRALPWRNLLASSHEFLNVTQATSTKAVSLCRQLDAIPEQPSKYGGLSLSVPFAPANSGPGWFRKLPREFDESRRRAVKLQRDINETSLRLQSNFAILSAREQIIEARSITNLTELAFFFIPFSFSAAVFSMQVHELDNGVPISVWFAISVGLAAAAYATRLALRSHLVVSNKHRFISSVRTYAHLPPGNDDIPTRKILNWMLHKFVVGVIDPYLHPLMLLYRMLRALPKRTAKALRSEGFHIFLRSSGLKVGILGLIFVLILPVSLVWSIMPEKAKPLKVAVTMVCLFVLLGCLVFAFLYGMNVFVFSPEALIEPLAKPSRRKNSGPLLRKLLPLLRNRLAWEFFVMLLVIPIGPSIVVWKKGQHLSHQLKVSLTLIFTVPAIIWLPIRLYFRRKRTAALMGQPRPRGEESTVGMDCEEIEVVEATNEQNPVFRNGRRIRNIKRAKPPREGPRRRIMDWVTEVRASAYTGAETTTTSNSSL